MMADSPQLCHAERRDRHPWSSPSPPRAKRGEGDHAKHGGGVFFGGDPAGHYPSTTLRAGPKIPKASLWEDLRADCEAAMPLHHGPSNKFRVTRERLGDGKPYSANHLADPFRGSGLVTVISFLLFISTTDSHGIANWLHLNQSAQLWSGNRPLHQGPHNP